MEMEDYSGAKVCQYTMEMPAFVTTQTLSLPSFDRDVSIQVIVTADGQQSDLGSFEPGSVVRLGERSQVYRLMLLPKMVLKLIYRQ